GTRTPPRAEARCRVATGCRRGRWAPPPVAPPLLQLDGRALLLQLGLDLVGLLLGDALLDHLGGAVDEVLGLLEAEAGDLAHDLDDLDLLLARGLQDDVELGLLLGRRGRRATRGGGRGHR